MSTSTLGTGRAIDAPESRTMKLSDWSVSAVAAGLLAVLVSYSGPMGIVYQAWQVSGLPVEVFSSWVWGISMAACISGVFLSLKYRTPVITAWSAPGAALLIVLIPNVSMPEIIGAYLFSGLLLVAVGLSGQFDRLVAAIPKSIAAGMMAGILLQFGLKAFASVQINPALATGLIALFLLMRRFLPKYALLIVLGMGTVASSILGLTQFDQVHLAFTLPSLTWPVFAPEIILSFGIPLFITSLTGQFLPGMSILRKDGYSVSANPILITTGMTSILVAFTGGITTVIAAITAALCTGKEAHSDVSKRYIAGVANGVFYGIGACFASGIAALFSAIPVTVVALIAGLGLMAAIGTNLKGIFSDPTSEDSGLITFLVTASGLTVLQLGSAFWGIVFGLLAHWILSPQARKQHQKKSEM